jgi:spermidine/putrescine transport system permease protein
MKRYLLCLPVAVLLLFLYLPIISIVIKSFGNIESFGELFTSKKYIGAIANTFVIAIVSSLFATIIATMAVVGITKMGRRNRTAMMVMNQLPIVNADIVVSFSLVLLFITLGIYNAGYLKLFFCHTLIALPFVLLTILPRMRQLDENLYDAALDLGASPFGAFWKVIIPQLMPAIVNGFLLGFTLSLDDFVITQYNNDGIHTISTVIYSAIAKKDIPNVFYALTTIIFGIIAIGLCIYNFIFLRKRGKQK